MKKRVVSLIAAMMIFGGSLTASADVPDISNLTDEEMVELLSNVNSAIVERGIEKSTELIAGKYTVGPDVPPGSYIISCTLEDRDWTTIKIFDAAGELIFCENLAEDEAGYRNMKGHGEWKVTLEEGDTINLMHKATLTISPGVIFE